MKPVPTPSNLKQPPPDLIPAPPSECKRKIAAWLILLGAMILPTLITLAHFVWLVDDSGSANPLQQAVYLGGCLFLIIYPAAGFRMLMGYWPRPGKPVWGDLWLAIGFGVVVGAGAIVLYYLLLFNTDVLDQTSAQLHTKLREFGIASTMGFASFAALLTIVHSLVEEYYWRWFVFGRLLQLLSPLLAIALSSIAFMAHHAILLLGWFPDHVWTAAVPFSLCVALGGAVWAWMYLRSGSIYTVWISHMLVDAAIFVIAYDLYFAR